MRLIALSLLATLVAAMRSPVGLADTADETPISVETSRPADVVDLTNMAPDIALDIRYFTPFNFVGRPIRGYQSPRCLLTRPAAAALTRVQAALAERGYGLKVYDCYRPQRAVDAFVTWAADLNDQAMKTAFYPNVDKRHLFRDGYIAARSGHSRASTVDLTIVPLPPPEQPPHDKGAPQRSCENPAPGRYADNSVDMGTGFDCFSPLSHTDTSAIPARSRRYRMLLKELMEAEGFRNLPEEWWHFTLKNEPYPDTYYDFPVE